MTQPARKPRSVPLTREERKSLKEFRKTFDTEVACAIAIGIDRTVLNAVMLRGSGSVESIQKIRSAIERGE